MKFIVIKASDYYEENPREVEIKTIEDLIALQKQMQKEHLKNCKKPEFSDCKLILDFKLKETYGIKKPKEITVYDYYIE